MDCQKIKIKMNESEYLKSVFCYDYEKSQSEYCISLFYQNWLLKLDFDKYCMNNISKDNKK